MPDSKDLIYANKMVIQLFFIRSWSCNVILHRTSTSKFPLPQKP